LNKDGPRAPTASRASALFSRAKAAWHTEVWKTRRFWRVFASNLRAWLAAPGSDRLPLQPWRLERHASDVVLRTFPAGPVVTRISPVAYSVVGSSPSLWPTAESLQPAVLELAHANDVTVIPRNVFLNVRGEVMRRSFAAGRFRNEGLKRLQLVNRYFSRAEISGAPVATIEGPALAADSPWAGGYGHVLLEIAPMALLLESCPPETEFVTSAPRSRTLLVLLEQLGVAPERVRNITNAIVCRDLYFGERAVRLSGQVHPLARRAFTQLSGLAGRSRIVRHDRVYLSRSGVDARRLDVEKEVEALFARYGFEIVHPEAIEIEDQIALMAGARMLAGLGGSAMHNAVFAPPDCPVLIVQPRMMSVAMDVGLCESGRRLGYVFGDGDPFADRFVAPWSVDLGDVEAGIQRHFGL